MYVCVCVFLLHYLCYQPARLHPGRQGAGKRKPESVRRAWAAFQEKLTNKTHDTAQSAQRTDLKRRNILRGSGTCFADYKQLQLSL